MPELVNTPDWRDTLNYLNSSAAKTKFKADAAKNFQYIDDNVEAMYLNEYFDDRTAYNTLMRIVPGVRLLVYNGQRNLEMNVAGASRLVTELSKIVSPDFITSPTKYWEKPGGEGTSKDVWGFVRQSTTGDVTQVTQFRSGKYMQKGGHHLLLKSLMLNWVANKW